MSEMGFTSTLFDMHGRELDKVTRKIKLNGLKHFGNTVVVSLGNGWYDFTEIKQTGDKKITTFQLKLL